MINKLKKKLKEFKSNNELLTISLNSTKNKIEIYEN